MVVTLITSECQTIATCSAICRANRSSSRLAPSAVNVMFTETMLSALIAADSTSPAVTVASARVKHPMTLSLRRWGTTEASVESHGGAVRVRTSRTEKGS